MVRTELARWQGGAGRLCFFLLLLSFAIPSFADVTNPGDTSDMGSLFTSFTTEIRDTVWPALITSDAWRFAGILFIFFAVIIALQVIMRWMFGAITIPQILEIALFVAMVHALQVTYDGATSLMWTWANAFGGSIQESIVGTDQLFFVPSYISGIMRKLSVVDVNFFLDGIRVVLAVIALSILSFILSCLAYFAAAWGIWGYVVAKLVGFMFVPTLLFERLEFLWDGWLRFFFGFLIFTVLARVQLALTALIFRLYYFPTETTYTLGGPFTFGTAPHDLHDYLGVIVMIVIAICGILSTGRFAMAIAGGVGGFGGALRSVASSTSAGLTSLAKAG